MHIRWSLAVLLAVCLSIVSLASAEAQDKQQDKPLKIIALGDSLTAGYGVGPGEALPDRLEAALKARGLAVRIVNAGVSGETAQDGLARLDWSLDGDVDAAIVCFGGNDFLRGLPPATTRAAIDGLVGGIRARGLPVLLVGMRAPANMGADYIAAFDPIFPETAARHGALFYPFLLDGVALDASLNQRDGLHPNPRGVDIIVGRILPMVEALVAAARSRRG